MARTSILHVAMAFLAAGMGAHRRKAGDGGRRWTRGADRRPNGRRTAATCRSGGDGSCQASPLGKYSDVAKDTRERGIEFGGACGGRDRGNVRGDGKDGEADARTPPPRRTGTWCGSMATCQDLPGFTRTVYERDHALVTPESRVWTGLPGWKNAVGAHFVSPAMMSTHFTMYLAKMGDDSAAGMPPKGVERFVFVVEGTAEIQLEGRTIPLEVDHYAYLPPNLPHEIKSKTGAVLHINERVYSVPHSGDVNKRPQFLHGIAEEQPVLPVPGETFVLRKLLPQTPEYDFNIHVMDFQPGEFLNVKEYHYNQHSLLLLQGQGIYRLGENWYPVQAGDVIWMGAYVPQWYCALGKQRSRYILYKDTNRDPLFEYGTSLQNGAA